MNEEQFNDMLKSWADEEVAFPAELHKKTMDKIKETKTEQKKRPRWQGTVATLAAALLMCVPFGINWDQIWEANEAIKAQKAEQQVAMTMAAPEQPAAQDQAVNDTSEKTMVAAAVAEEKTMVATAPSENNGMQTLDVVDSDTVEVLQEKLKYLEELRAAETDSEKIEEFDRKIKAIQERLEELSAAEGNRP